VTNVTYGGANLTHVLNARATGNGGDSSWAGADLWYRLAPASGTANIVVTFQGTVSRTVIMAYSLAGMVQQAPEASAAKGGIRIPS
jgi:hypothetical protein